jgi:hypothetical protein
VIGRGGLGRGGRYRPLRSHPAMHAPMSNRPSDMRSNLQSAFPRAAAVSPAAGVPRVPSRWPGREDTPFAPRPVPDPILVQPRLPCLLEARFGTDRVAATVAVSKAMTSSAMVARGQRCAPTSQPGSRPSRMRANPLSRPPGTRPEESNRGISTPPLPPAASAKDGTKQLDLESMRGRWAQSPPAPLVDQVPQPIQPLRTPSHECNQYAPARWPEQVSDGLPKLPKLPV